MNLITTGISPHIRSSRTTRKVMLDVVIALMPTLVAAVIIFGFRALLLTAVSVAACVLSEFAWDKLMHKDITVGDCSAVVTGVLLAFNVPVGMPVWQLIIGDVAAIIGVKMLFGGLGCNFMNPALVGRIVLTFSFPAYMTTYVFPSGGLDALSSATPLVVLDQLGSDSFMQLFLGMHGGVIGETCAATLLLGGIYLVARRVIKPIIPLCFIGSCLLFSWLFGGAQPLLGVFSGGLMLASFFMATDYVTSPLTDWGKVIFGLGCGFITAVIRVFGNYAEGCTFSVLLMNLLVPYINAGTMRKPLGGTAVK